jgi:5-methylcytosine-specific restriction protein B
MNELERRRRKFAQIRAAFAANEHAQVEWATADANRAQRGPEAFAILDRLTRTSDLASFQSDLEAWSRRPGYEAFHGFGLMFINQLALRAAEDPEPVARLLASVLQVPGDEEDATAKLGQLVEHVERVQRGGHPAPGRVPFIVSFFWGLQDHPRWPVMWSSAEEMLRVLGWLRGFEDQADRYLRFRSVIQDLDADPREAERYLFWVRSHPFCGLDAALVVRCAENTAILHRWQQQRSYQSSADASTAEDNVYAVRGELSLLGRAVRERVGDALDRPVTLPTVQLTVEQSTGAPFRSDGQVVWAPAGGFEIPRARVWATDAGLAVGIHAGWAGRGWHQRVGEELASSLPSGIEFFKVRSHLEGTRLEPAGDAYPGGEVFVGRWFPGTQALDRIDFADDVVGTLLRLRPVFDRLLGAQGDGEPEAAPPPSGKDDALDPLVERFRAERGYPSEQDEWQRAERANMAASLDPEGLEAFDLPVFRKIINTRRWGGPGPQSILNETLSAADPVTLEQFAQTIHELLWGEGDDEARIDRVLDPGDLGFRGLGESVVMKLLAIAHPERYLPVFPYTGDMGKQALMQRIGLSPPHAEGRSRGQLQVLANDLIRQRLEPHFPGDPWGQAQFLYWLRRQDEQPPQAPDGDVLGELAEHLLVDRGFLDEIVALLRDKGQVILYGPPGTGKTFLARQLAAALAPNPECRMVVQFHPSTSYEDFVEGYRPTVGDDGQMAYALVQGPLVRMAERAEAASGVEHVLVIDEINRANLPKVLGELLYLLEYRKEAVRALYRPDEPFQLPENLLFIGTMNTADRSIALVDAALRRRFHFVPFFPHEGAIEGLLARWLDQNGEPAWVANMVDMVNEELRDRLGGPHLQIGPSHFMRPGLDLTALRRIWVYNVFPFIEEQLYGEWAEVDDYRFEVVLERFRQVTGLAAGAGPDATAAADTVPDEG